VQRRVSACLVESQQLDEGAGPGITLGEESLQAEEVLGGGLPSQEVCQIDPSTRRNGRLLSERERERERLTRPEVRSHWEVFSGPVGFGMARFFGIHGEITYELETQAISRNRRKAQKP
jgi:hypothetical protein